MRWPAIRAYIYCDGNCGSSDRASSLPAQKDVACPCGARAFFCVLKSERIADHLGGDFRVRFSCAGQLHCDAIASPAVTWQRVFIVTACGCRHSLSLSLCLSARSVSSNAAVRCIFTWLFSGESRSPRVVYRRSDHSRDDAPESSLHSQRRLHVKSVDNNTQAVIWARRSAASHAEHASRAQREEKW